MFSLISAALVLLSVTACEGITTPPDHPGAPGCTTSCAFRVVASYPHDRNAFTQGLAYENGFLYEGTGLNGASTLRKVELATGQVLQSVALPRAYFGEGIVIWKETIV